MRLSCGRFVALIVALAAVLAHSGTASATTGIGISPGGAITANSVGRITFTGGAVSISCDISLTGTLAASVAKVAGTSFGSITAGTSTSCGTGVVSSVLTATPWAVQYRSFTGTLPSISTLTQRWAPMTWSYGAVTIGTCLYTTPGLGFTFTPPRALAIDASNSWTKAAGGALCPTSGRWSGAFALTTSHTLSLI